MIRFTMIKSLKLVQRHTALTLGMLLLLLVVTTGSMAGMQVAPLTEVPSKRVSGDNHWVVYADEPIINKPITVSTSIKLNAGWDDYDRDAPAIDLIGLAYQPGAAPHAISLAWRQDKSGWFPKWQMVLGGELYQAASGYALGNSSASPISGHTYTATMSYNPATGALSALVVDADTHEVIYTAAAAALHYQKSLYLSAGAAWLPETKAPPVEISHLRLANLYLPLGDDWAIGVKTKEGFMPGWGFDASDDWCVRLTTPETTTTNGRYEIALKHNGRIVIVQDVVPTEAVNWAQLPKDNLPLGKSELAISYVVDGRKWLTDKSEVVIGKVDLSFQPLKHNKPKGTVDGVLTVKSNDNLPALPVKVEAAIYAKEWDPISRKYRKTELTSQVVFSGKINVKGALGTQGIPVSVPVPSEPGLWEATLHVTADTDVLVNAFDTSLAFNTYQPATISDGEPFTIAILPDTQFYSNVGSLNQIFLRQAQWIAENAAAKNIGLTLHMGDITHLNLTNEWHVAQSSMQTLDGVVPYVMAIGNHDTFVGTKWTTGASPINEYFPAQSFPHLQGTFEVNRIDSAYYTFRFNSIDYLILTLEFSPRDAVLDWANEVVAAHPDHRVIVVTHAYLLANGGRVTEPNLPPGTNDSHTIWDKFVRKHKNILMVLAGHVPAENVPYSIDVGDNRNVVYNLLFDYQSDENGGNGWLGLLEFMPDNTINVSAYSPYLDQYKTGRDRFGFPGRYVIPIGKLPKSIP